MESIYAYVMDAFERTQLTYQEIADGSGVPRRTVEKVARQEVEDPSVSTVERLAQFFRSQTKKAA